MTDFVMEKRLLRVQSALLSYLHFSLSLSCFTAKPSSRKVTDSHSIKVKIVWRCS